MDKLKYPIGQFIPPKDVSLSLHNQNVQIISELPELINISVSKLNDDQLNTSYREGGWTLRQVVHHVADSHLNGYIRFKWALSENDPEIKAYEQDGWSKLPDAASGNLELSLSLLDSLHKRWVYMIRELTVNELQKGFFYPGKSRYFTLFQATALYAWHGLHHNAHITSLCERNGW